MVFWAAFFALVGVLLFLDLRVLHRGNQEQSLTTSALWTVGWVALGLSFAGVVFLIYNHRGADGSTAAVAYVSAYLLEQALSVDNLFVIALVFERFRVPGRYRHRVLFWGILGAIAFRLA